MLRFFGFTTDVSEWVKWIGQCHTRFADLPASLRFSQLRLWNRPPIEESRLAAWVELGLASVHQRLAHYGEADDWLESAEKKAGVAAEIEADLFRARLRSDSETSTEPRPLLPSSARRSRRLPRKGGALDGASRMAQQLEDENLLRRVTRRKR